MKKQFTRATVIPEEQKTDVKKETKFASEDEQYVLEETKARASGMTANRTSENKQEITTEKRERKGNLARIKKQNLLDLRPPSPLEHVTEELKQDVRRGIGDVEVGQAPPIGKPVDLAPDGSRPLELPSFGSVERGYSTLGEELPKDIKFGDFTALNTDRHLFYTFYARMEEKIRPRWLVYAKAVTEGPEAELIRLSSHEFVTGLEIILDSEGRFQKALLMQGSGIKGFDSAPVQAFRDAQQFPNPPKEMVKDDGLVHLYYGFTVHITPRYAGAD